MPRLNWFADPARVFVLSGFFWKLPRRGGLELSGPPRTCTPTYGPPLHIATPRARHRATGRAEIRIDQ